MAKQFGILVILTLIIIALATELSHGLNFLISEYQSITHQMSDIFTSSTIGRWIQRLLSLIILPILAGLIPGLIYFALKRKQMPYLVHIIWIVWLIEVTAVLALGKL